MDEIDPIEVQIVTSCKARGMSCLVPLLRYRLARDQAKQEAEYSAYVAGITVQPGASPK